MHRFVYRGLAAGKEVFDWSRHWKVKKCFIQPNIVKVCVAHRKQRNHKALAHAVARDERCTDKLYLFKKNLDDCEFTVILSLLVCHMYGDHDFYSVSSEYDTYQVQFPCQLAVSNRERKKKVHVHIRYVSAGKHVIWMRSQSRVIVLNGRYAESLLVHLSSCLLARWVISILAITGIATVLKSIWAIVLLLLNTSYPLSIRVSVCLDVCLFLHGAITARPRIRGTRGYDAEGRLNDFETQNINIYTDWFNWCVSVAMAKTNPQSGLPFIDCWHIPPYCGNVPIDE